MKWLKKKSTRKFGHVAMQYYPDHSYKQAVHLFRQELRLTRGLLKALMDVGYRDNQRILNARQLRIISHYLGDP